MDSNNTKHNLLEYISLNTFPECISGFLKYTVLYKFLELSINQQIKHEKINYTMVTYLY